MRSDCATSQPLASYLLCRWRMGNDPSGTQSRIHDGADTHLLSTGIRMHKLATGGPCRQSY